MTSEVWTQLLLLIISILGVLVTKVLVPYIKTRTTTEQREDIEYWTGVAIQSIEQYYIDYPKKGAVKKEYVMSFMTKHGYKITEDQMSILIDVLVEELVNKPREELMIKTAFLTN